MTNTLEELTKLIKDTEITLFKLEHLKDACKELKYKVKLEVSSIDKCISKQYHEIENTNIDIHGLVVLKELQFSLRKRRVLKERLSTISSISDKLNNMSNVPSIKRGDFKI